MSKTARLLFFLAVATATPGHALTFTVDSTADEVDFVPGNGVCNSPGGACTLRAAIQEANAFAGPDVIDLPSGTYTLTIPSAGGGSADGDLDVGNSGMLVGAGAATTIIDGGGLDRVFAVGGTFAISDVTIQNGLATTGDGGGGILSFSALTLERVIIRDNHAPNLSGGGIASVISGTLEMRDSVVTGNTAARGGGIHQLVDSVGMTLSNVTISGNSATGSGGGLNDSVFGARLYNVTVTGNTADSDANGSGDGGGISSIFSFLFGPNVILRNTIVAGNTDTGGEAPDCVVMGFASITSEGYNLIGDTTGCTISGNMIGNVTNVDPMLDPLADNGGDTLTHALLPGSFAGDGGNPAPPGSGGTACEATDQRGVTRPVGSRCDIGAFEGGTFSTTLDHYKCYSGADLRTPPFSQLTVDTTDQIGNEMVDVKKLKYVCTPVDKNGEGINDPAAHLTCYQVKSDALPSSPTLLVSTQFQTSRFAAKKSKLLCLPSTKTVLP